MNIKISFNLKVDDEIDDGLNEVKRLKIEVKTYWSFYIW